MSSSTSLRNALTQYLEGWKLVIEFLRDNYTNTYDDEDQLIADKVFLNKVRG